MGIRYKIPDEGVVNSQGEGVPTPSCDSSLIKSLSNPSIYSHPVWNISIVETHISWIILTGEYAYKIKKPINFGFLDFSTLAQRRHFCEEELRLNKRFSPDLYLAVIPITGHCDSPILNGSGMAIEYAVQMRQFPSQQLLSDLASRGKLNAAHIDQMIDVITAFHAHADITDVKSVFGSPIEIDHWAVENFQHIMPLVHNGHDKEKLEILQSWCAKEFKSRSMDMQDRKSKGFIRECHGDLHLGNMTLINGWVTLFDCIEFNPELRWIDVINDVAFVVMDLEAKGHTNYAYRFLNGYLQKTGDYTGIRLLRYYLVYRALVRAKVSILKIRQTEENEKTCSRILKEFQMYVGLASRYSEVSQPLLIITHGVSGTGKSTYASQLSELLPAIQIRSDVERKRMAGFQSHSNTQSGIQSGIYSADSTRRTYNYLLEQANVVLDAGISVIIDATFLKRVQRSQFQKLANKYNVPFIILAFTAPETVLHERILQRNKTGKDASEAGIEVLGVQLASQDKLSEDEMPNTVDIDTTMQFSIERIIEAIKRKI